TPIAVPFNATQATLSFWHRYNLEVGPSFAYDGGVLEESTDDVTWADASFISGGYNYTVLSCSSSNPLAGRRAWSGDIGGWQQAAANLMPYRGQSVYFRFRLGTDETGSAPGWWVDDVTVSFTQS